MCGRKRERHRGGERDTYRVQQIETEGKREGREGRREGMREGGRKRKS